jgi:phosphoribosylanthranilate isomerase
MRTRVKICCIASIEEAKLAIAAGADAIGLVAAMPSGSGMISDALIADIAAATPPPITTFLLTSQTSADAISHHVRNTRPAAVQIVSHIDPAESARLAVIEPHVRRVQVIHIEGTDALDVIPLYAPHIHAFLLDSGRPNAPERELGGTGRVHDWAVSAAFVRASPKPVFLAGGLHPGNVMEAIHRVRPFGIDLCSGVRTNGRLDGIKLKSFMAQLKAADESLTLKSRS